MSVAVNAEANGNYEPSEGEIVEYGKWLGMKLPEDNAFLWIAREGLKAPLPENWKACQSDKNELYYFNFKTGQSIWDHPMDEHFKELFKNEKQHPTPRSIAAGAKRKEEPTSAKKEGKPKKKTSADKGAKESPSAAIPQTSTSDAPRVPNTSTEAKEKSPKLQALKSVKVKKELPKEMRIEFDGNNAEKGTALQPTLLQSQPALAGPQESHFTTPQNGSAGGSAAEAKPASAEETNGPKKVESPAAGGGLKSLRVLCENTNRSTPPKDSVSLDPAALKEAAIAEEKERLMTQAKAELEGFKAQLRKERQATEELLAAESAEAIKEARDKAEKERRAKVQELQRKSEEALLEEQRSIERELKAAIEQAKKDIQAHKSAETRRLQENSKEQLEQEKKKLAEEYAEKLEAFAQEQRRAADAKREAASHYVRDSEKALESELSLFSSSLVRAYEESYAAFSKSVSSSQNDFALRSIQQKEEAQRELDAQLEQIRKDHQNAIDMEKKSFHQEVESIRSKLAAEKAQVAEAGLREMEKLRSQAASQVGELRSAQEKALLAETVAELRANQARELEALKAELRRKAEEELKAAMPELVQEQKVRLGAQALQREPPQKGGEPERSPSVRLDGDETAGAKPPLLDGNLLRSSTDPTFPEAYAVLRDNQAKDIKSAVTEALREMFAESPFTLPSPARGSVSPSRQDAAAGRRSSAPGSAPVGADIGVPPTWPQKPPAFSFPMSFQDQRDLVDGERRRVREGRKLVETQRKNLEDRRQQLRHTRHQWKQDVMAAKEEGVRSSSKRGQLLNKVRLALEEQAKGLEHDEAILHESMGWLQSKEQRLMQLEQQIEEQERMRVLGDNSTMNCSVDTAALVTGFFRPQRGTGAFPSDNPGERRTPLSTGALSGTIFTPFESPATTPVLSNALSRIERRLDEVTSLISLQKGSLSPSSRHQQQQLGNRRISLSTPTTGQSQGRSRTPRRHSKAAAVEAGRENHADPW